MTAQETRKPRGMYFEDFEVGMTLTTPARTVTSTDIVNFACLTGDFNEVHCNYEYAKTTPFGEVIGVRNLRAAGGGTLSRGRRQEEITVVELPPAEAARVLKATLATYPSLIKGYFDVTPDSPLAEFEREAPRHPLFRIVSVRPRSAS